jgi:hypothetical protein
MKHAILACCLLLFTNVAVAAEPDPSAPTPFTLTPKAPPHRALQFQLLPEVVEQTSGNAVTFYKKAEASFAGAAGNQEQQNEVQEQLSKYLQVSLKDLPRDEVRDFLKPYAQMFKEIEAGARCESCDWELTDGLRKQGVGALLPGVHEVRGLARFLAVRARLELADGKPDQAIRTLRSGMALGRHVGDNPTIICALVGTAVSTMILERLEEVVQHEKAPNLYWALTDLPRPFIDMRKPLQGERLMAYGSLPAIRDAITDLNAGPLPEKDLEEAVKFLGGINDGFSGFAGRVLLAQSIRAKHETAKRALIELGRPKDKVEAMSHIQVALLHSFAQYDRVLDDVIKLQSFPHWQAQEQLRDTEKKLKREFEGGEDAPAIPLAKLLMPSVDKVLISRVRLDRRFAALRCVEAVRLYAAAHDGKLPAKLDDIKEVPVPVDPMTGKSFGYRIAEGKAVLSSPMLQPELTYPGNAITYEISLRR